MNSIIKNIMRPFANNANKSFSQRGVAILMAIFSMAVMVVIALEVSERATVEYLISSRGINQVKAYYSAKAGIDMGLLRVLLYKKANAAVGDKLGDNKSALNMIWNTPIMWPPQIPNNATGFTVDEVTKVKSESIFSGQYFVTIESEDSKIDINALGSGSKALAKATKEQLLELLSKEVETNEAFAEEHKNDDFEELINNITDWVDEDEESLTGTSEGSGYSKFNSDLIPPNQPFKTLEEIKMVKDLSDDVYQLLKQNVTVYGAQGINVNLADTKILTSLSPQITDEIAAEIKKHIADPDKGPFKNLEDFNSFLDYEGVSDFNTEGIPLFFDIQYNFRIKSVGQSTNITKEIEVVTFDFEGIKETYITALTKQAEEDKAPSDDEDPQDPKSTDDPKKTPSGTDDTTDKKEDDKKDSEKKTITYKGRPQIVYWWEN
ncbi:MAG: hypothetical protein HOO06_02875 [Bdellovibrionaceae bacterium]|jgi:type II secretory pathway component PulK|nr:hypothetical protein [Pseudobdellovibrionaceae bacterium]